MWQWQLLVILLVMMGSMFPIGAQRTSPNNLGQRVCGYYWGTQAQDQDPFGQAISGNQITGSRCFSVTLEPFWSPDDSSVGPANPDIRPLSDKIRSLPSSLFVANKGGVVITMFSGVAVLPPGTSGATGAYTLKRMAYREREVFTDAQWQELLTKWYQEGFDAMTAAMETSQQYEVPLRLRNWEAAHDGERDSDWSSDGVSPGPYLEFLQAWFGGMRSARNEQLANGSKGRVDVAFQFVHTGPSMSDGGERLYRYSDMLEGMKALKDVVDVWDYSSWQSWVYPSLSGTEENLDELIGLAVKINQESFANALQTINTGCLAAGVQRCRKEIGEFGYLHNRPESSEVFSQVLRYVSRYVELVGVWAMYDDPTQGDLSPFGSFTLTGEMTEQGRIIQSLLARPPVLVYQ